MAKALDPEVIEKERKALELRRAGITYDVIAERTGYSDRSAARKAVQRALKRTLAGPAKELRDLEADRLDRLQAGLWAEAAKGHLGSVDRILKIMDRRARLLGLDIEAERIEATRGLVLNFGIPRPDPRASDAGAIPQTELTEV